MTMTVPVPFVPQNRRDALMLEIARAFNDEERLPDYQRVCAGVPFQLVFRAYREAMSVPSHQVRKSRRAIFFFIVHSLENDQDSRN